MLMRDKEEGEGKRGLKSLPATSISRSSLETVVNYLKIL